MSEETCSHAACTCEGKPPDGYCSTYCRTAAEEESARGAGQSPTCRCGHPPCGVR